MSTKCQLKSVISHRIAGIIGITIPNIPYKNYMDTKYGCGYRDGIVLLIPTNRENKRFVGILKLALGTFWVHFVSFIPRTHQYKGVCF